VRLNSLHLTNFRQHADTRIEFDLGLTGIIGPNGAGKTTVLEAIAWALYGQSAVRGTRDSIRNVRAGARAAVRVELDFDLSGHRYRVVRGLSSAELYLDGGSEPIATTITDVADLLARRLGMTRAEFFYTYFTGQKELSVMAAMAPTERAQFLSRVLGYDRIRAAQGIARERRKELVARISGVKEMMPDPQLVESMLKESSARRKEAERRRSMAAKAHKGAESALAVLAPQWEAAQRAREALQQLVSDLRLAQHAADGLVRESERLTRELDAVAQARAELESIATQLAPLGEVMDEYRMLDALAREEGRRRTLAESLRAVSEELSTLRARQATLASTAGLQDETTTQLKSRMAALEAATVSLEARRTEWVRDQQEAVTKRDALRLQYQDVKTQRDRIVELGEDGICPTCQRVLGDHFRSVYDGLEEQLETIAVDGKYFTTRLEQLEGMLGEIRELEEQRKAMSQEVNELERALARAQSAAQELALLGRELSVKEQRHDQLANELRGIPSGFDQRRHAELERELERLGPLNEQAARLSSRVDREAALREEHDKVSRQLADARDRVAALAARYEETHFSEEDLQRQRHEYEEAVAAMRVAELELQAATSDEARATEAVATAERARQDLERARDLHAKLEAERRLHDELDRAYTDLRTDLNFQLRPELSELASQFLNQLTDGRYAELELDDQYSLVVLEDGIPKPVISGGEEDLSNLVLRLAISQMIADRSGQSFSLLVLDEVFGSLDVARRQNVVDLLRRLEDRFEQVILITHIEGVKDELDHVVLVDYDDQAGATRVRQVELSVPDLDGLNADPLPAGAET
jgi:exonuclease SbcC